MKKKNKEKKNKFSWKSLLQGVGIILGAIASIFMAVVKVISGVNNLKECFE